MVLALFFGAYHLTMVVPDPIIRSLGDHTNCPFSSPGLGRVERFYLKCFSIVNMCLKSPEDLVKVKFLIQ